MDKQACRLNGVGNLLDTYTLGESWANHVAFTSGGIAGVVASIREVIGISTVETLVLIVTQTTTGTEAPVETTIPTEPTPLPEGGISPYLLLGFLASGVILSVGYLYRERLQPPFMKKRI